MKLLTAPASPFGRKVKIAAIERDLIDRIELVMVNTTPLASDANLARDNPLIKIPTLIIDGGIALYDSLVICDYFDSLHGAEKLIPTKSVLCPVPRCIPSTAASAICSRYSSDHGDSSQRG